jgi:hypothetical protein
MHSGSYFTSAFAASSAIKISLTPARKAVNLKYRKPEG